MNCKHLGKILRLIVFASFGAGGVSAAESAKLSGFEQLLNWRALPTAPVDAIRFLGGFAGAAGERFLVVEDSPERVIWALGSKSGGGVGWERLGTLRAALTPGVSLGGADGLLCVGGPGGDAPGAVTWLRSDTAKVQLLQESLPSLPVGTRALNLARIGSMAYALLVPGDAPANSTALWSLDLARSEGWRAVSAVPSVSAAGAAMVAQDNGRAVALFVFGAEDGRPAAWEFQPTAKVWRARATPPASFAGATALRSGIHHVLVAGAGDGAAIWVYHTVTDSWSPVTPALGKTERVVGEWSGTWVTVDTTLKTPEVRQGSVRSPRVGFKVADYVVVGIYLAVLLAIGFYFSRGETTTRDFFLAGGRIPWWAAGLSIYGTQLSAITFMSIPAKTYGTDWSYLLVNMGIVAVAPFVVMFFLPFFVRLKLTTAYEYLELRFNLPIRLLGSALFILFQIGRVGIVLYLPALALSVVTGIDVTVCILLMGVVCTIYTVTGGIEAVIWSDVLQVAVLLVGAVFCLVLMAIHVEGGLTAIFTTAAAAEKTKVFDWSPGLTTATSWVLILAWPTQLIPYTSDQSVIQRYLTTPDESSARRGIWTNALITLPGTFLFFAIGTALWAFFRANPGELAPGLAQHDSIFPWFIVHQMPAGVSGLLIAGVFAASMSSVDSSLNSVATAVVTDFYRRLRANASEAGSMKVARIVTVAFGAVGTAFALFMAESDVRSLWDRFNELMGLLGGGLAGLFILGIFTRRANAPGALVGLAASAIIQYLVKTHTDLIFFLYSTTGLLTCVVVGYAASLFFRNQPAPAAGLTLRTVKRQPPS